MVVVRAHGSTAAVLRRFSEYPFLFACPLFRALLLAVNLALLREALGRSEDGSPSQASEAAMTSMVSYVHTCIDTAPHLAAISDFLVITP